MPNKSLISKSSDGHVIQQLYWDTSSKKIEVVHTINLDAYRRAEWSSMYPYEDTDAEYNNKCLFYGIDPKNKTILTEFVYDEYKSDRTFAQAVKFPTDGGFYYLTNIPHVVAVKLNRYEAGQVSKTSGEALP